MDVSWTPHCCTYPKYQADLLTTDLYLELHSYEHGKAHRQPTTGWSSTWSISEGYVKKKNTCKNILNKQ